MTPTLRQVTSAACAASRITDPRRRRIAVALARAMHTVLLDAVQSVGRYVDEVEGLTEQIEPLPPGERP